MAIYSLISNNSDDSIYENSWFLHFRYWLVRALACPLFGDSRVIPILGGKTLPELFTVFAYFAVCIAIGASGDSLTAGRIAEVLGLVLMLFAMRSNFILSGILGMSFERSIFWHKVTAYVIIALFIIHGVGEGFNTSGIALAVLIGLAGVFYSFSFIKGYWNWFYYPHMLLYIGTLVASAAHGASIFTLSVIIWGIDLGIRYILANRKVSCEITPVGSNVIKLTFPKTFAFWSGQYAFIMVGNISYVEYHPFSFASAAYEDKATFYIKAAGDWTQKLYDLSKTKIENPSVFIEGPYGVPTINVFDPSVYKVIVLVSGGIGVTPNLGLLKALVHHRKDKAKFNKIIFVWTMRETDVAEYIYQNEIQPLLSSELEANKDLDSLVDLRLHLSTAKTQDALEQQKSTLSSYQAWRPGRPDLSSILSEAGEFSEKSACGRVGVMVSGPAVLIEETKILCDRSLCALGCSSTRFDCHEEVFFF